jgi:hypothetical protein
MKIDVAFVTFASQPLTLKNHIETHEK